jgi:hypothetical protein
MSQDTTYTTGLSAKGALLHETLLVLRHLHQGLTVSEVKYQVIKEDMLAKDTMSTRESVWDRIHARYLSNEEQAKLLAHMVTRAPDTQTAKLVLFYEFCQARPLLYAVTTECIYPRYTGGFVGVDKSLIYQYLDQITTDHPEVTAWAPQTRDKIVSNILTVLRDFGLLEGVQRKEFTRLYVPLPAFVYVLYRLAEKGVKTPTEVLEAQDWHLFLLLQEEVLSLLEEASAAGHCTFKHQGDIYTLALTYPSLEVCVAALTREV